MRVWQAYGMQGGNHFRPIQLGQKMLAAWLCPTSHISQSSQLQSCEAQLTAAPSRRPAASLPCCLVAFGQMADKDTTTILVTGVTALGVGLGLGLGLAYVAGKLSEKDKPDAAVVAPSAEKADESSQIVVSGTGEPQQP